MYIVLALYIIYIIYIIIILALMSLLRYRNYFFPHSDIGVIFNVYHSSYDESHYYSPCGYCVRFC